MSLNIVLSILLLGKLRMRESGLPNATQCDFEPRLPDSQLRSFSPLHYTTFQFLRFLFFCQVAGAYSKTWSYREDSLLAIYKKMVEISTSTPKDDLKTLLKGAIFLIVRAIKDIVSSVSNIS